MRRLALLPLLLLAACGGGGETRTVERVVTVRDPATPAAAETTVPTGRFDPGAIYRREAPGVVTVVSVFEGGSLGSLLGQDGEDEGPAGQGSGFVLNRRGEIATNAHVVTNGQGEELKRAEEVYVEFADGNTVPAKIVGTDPNVDVALIRVDPDGLDLRPLPLARSVEDLAVGEPVVAIGSPFGEQQSLSVGVVSGLNRSINSLAGRFAISGAVQTDAAINHGNSGGPLVDADGRVIGINAQIESTGGGGEGVGFAVPVDSAKRSLAQMRRSGEARYAFLGVTSVPVYPQLAERFDLPVEEGAWVQEASAGGPAADAGLRGGTGDTRFQTASFKTGGDVIVSVDGERLTKENDLSAVVAFKSPGDEVELVLRRPGGDERTVRVELGARPSGG